MIETEQRERRLVEEFRDKKASYDALKEECELKLKQAKDEFMKVEKELMDLLDDQGKKSSATFEGLGKVTAVEPMIIASLVEGQEAVGLHSIRELGRGDMIREGIHWQTLSTFIKGLLKENRPLPEGVTYYQKRWLNFYPTK